MLLFAGSAQGAVVDLSVVNGQITVTDASNYIGTVTGDIFPVEAGNWYLICQSSTGTILGEKYGTGGGVFAFKNIPLDEGIILEIYPAPEDSDSDPSNNRISMDSTPTKQEVDLGITGKIEGSFLKLDVSSNNQTMGWVIAFNEDGASAGEVKGNGPGEYIFEISPGTWLVHAGITPVDSFALDTNPENDAWTGVVTRPVQQDLAIKEVLISGDTICVSFENKTPGATDVLRAGVTVVIGGHEETSFVTDETKPSAEACFLLSEFGATGEQMAFVSLSSDIADPDETNNDLEKVIVIGTKPETQSLVVTYQNRTTNYVSGKSKFLVDQFIIFGQLEPSGEKVSKNAHIEVSVNGETWIDAGGLPNPSGGYQCTAYRLLKENALKGKLFFRMILTDGTVSNVLEVKTLILLPPPPVVTPPPPVGGVDTFVSGQKSRSSDGLVTCYISTADKSKLLLGDVKVEISTNGGRTFSQVSSGANILTFKPWCNGYQANVRFFTKKDGDLMVKVTTPNDPKPENNIFNISI